MSSIKSKMIVIFTAVVLVVFIVSGTIMLQSVKVNETAKYREQLHNAAEAINEIVVIPSENADQFDRMFLNYQGANGIQGCILNSVGALKAPFDYFARIPFNDSSIVAALAGEEGFSVGKTGKDINGTDQQWINFAMPIVKDEERFVIFTRMNAKIMNDNLSDLTRTLVLMVIIALALTSALWFVFSNTLTKPIAALTKRAKEMAGGNLSSEIAVYGNDEIGQLAESFNFMAKELNQTLGTMASEKNKSEALLHNMTDGVLAYDAAGKLIHANNASSEFLQIDGIESVPGREMLARLGFEPDEVYTLTPEQARESAFESGDRFLSASVTPYMNKMNEVEGFIIVIQDVTKLTKLDIMRKEFVANVSHELRTPLTSITTYTETLMDGAIDDGETAMRFLKVINDETKRMSVLVRDLLELSRLDNKQTALEKEVIDLVGLLRLVIRQTTVLAVRKEQEINFDPPRKPYFIEANATRINQVLTNIITNSLKYSPEGSSVDVTMEVTEKYYRVFIKDHGMGIPADDIPHIFERFYRVDKARSRMMGGTGLGLAIAKEIIEEHGGRINVSSELGAGTTMVLRFKRYRDGTGQQA